MSIDREAARRTAERLLRTDVVGDQVARERGEVVAPVQVRTPAGGEAGWLAGVESSGRLLGLIQLQPDGRFRRYVSFRARHGSEQSCPRTEEWLDPSTVLNRARQVAAEGECLGPPVLTYDRSPDRIVWEVPASSPEGERTIQVIGDSVSVRSGGAPAGR